MRGRWRWRPGQLFPRHDRTDAVRRSSSSRSLEDSGSTASDGFTNSAVIRPGERADLRSPSTRSERTGGHSVGVQKDGHHATQAPAWVTSPNRQSQIARSESQITKLAIAQQSRNQGIEDRHCRNPELTPPSSVGNLAVGTVRRMDQAAPVEHHGTGRQRTRGVDKTRVLVVEDESDIAGLVKHTLERSGDAIVEVATQRRPGAEGRPASSRPT